MGWSDVSTRSPLIGNWRLVSFTQVGEDGKPFEFFGPEPKGHITYLESGYMSVLFASSQRKPYSGSWESVADRQKAENYEAMVAYSGRYTDHGDRVVHHVEICWIPNWEGRDLERFLTFLPDGRVRLRTPEKRFGRPQPIQDVIVERASATP
jgi:lipocalin-like protein